MPYVNPALLSIIQQHRWICHDPEEEDPDDPGVVPEEPDSDDMRYEQDIAAMFAFNLKYRRYPLDRLDMEAEHLRLLFRIARVLRLPEKYNGKYTYERCTYEQHYENLEPGWHPLPRNRDGGPILPTIGDVIFDMLSVHPTRQQIPEGGENNCWCVTLAPHHYNSKKLSRVRNFVSTIDKEKKRPIGPPSKTELRGFEKSTGSWVDLKGEEHKNPDGSYIRNGRGKTVGEPIFEAMRVRKAVGTLSSADGCKYYSQVDFFFDAAKPPHDRHKATKEVRLTFCIGKRSDVMTDDVSDAAHDNVKRKANMLPSDETVSYVKHKMDQLRSAQDIYSDYQIDKPFNVEFSSVAQIIRMIYNRRQMIEEELVAKRKSQCRTFPQKAPLARNVKHQKEKASQDESAKANIRAEPMEQDEKAEEEELGSAPPPSLAPATRKSRDIRPGEKTPQQKKVVKNVLSEDDDSEYFPEEEEEEEEKQEHRRVRRRKKKRVDAFANFIEKPSKTYLHPAGGGTSFMSDMSSDEEPDEPENKPQRTTKNVTKRLFEDEHAHMVPGFHVK